MHYLINDKHPNIDILKTTCIRVGRGLEDVGNCEAREGSVVPYGLHTGVQQLDLSELGRTGPKEQL